jgi:hypothetical protein
MEGSEMVIKQGPPINIAASSGDASASERACSGCTLCCSLLGIVELKKPVFKICKHCVIGKGCKIYDIKPATCSEFLCSYRISTNVPEHWNPKICGMVLHKENNILSIICSNGAKHRWKQEPYWSDIKQAAAAVHVQRTGGVRIIRKDEPVLVINPETFEAQSVGKLKGMASLPQWQKPDQDAGAEIQASGARQPN